MKHLGRLRRGDGPLLSTGLALLFLAGLFISAQIVLASFEVDADASQAAILFDGITRHGPAFVKDWVFTADNWLFSLYPITFALFSIFGAKPLLVILMGWLIFVVSVLVASLLPRAVGARRAALFVAPTLACAGLYAHKYGFLSYPVSHNVTNLFGLVAFLSLLHWIEARRWHWLFAIALALVLGGLSDPWIVVAYALPLTLTAFLLLAVQAGDAARRANGALCAVLIISLALIETRAFGTLDFLTPFHFDVGSLDRIRANSGHVLRGLGGLLNIVPGTAGNDPLPALASLLVFTGLTVAAARLPALGSWRDDPKLAAFCCTIALSVTGTAGAVTLSDVPAQDNVARFLINALYLGVAGTAALLDLGWTKASLSLRFGAIATAVMFAASGIVSSFPAWHSPAFAISDRGTRDVLQFLAENKLTYGYGPYWGSKANAATWLSDFGIRIRPVVFDVQTGMIRRVSRPQSSRRWLELGDAPPEQKDFFVFIKSDGEECPDLVVCVNGVIAQFGPPERWLHYGGAVVLVWPRPLLW